MEKKKSNGGFTLVELLCTLLIMVLLVMGMGVGMEAGSRIYRDATFESDSATLAGILNTNLGDILRYSTWVHTANEAEQGKIDNPKVNFLFTSLDYGIQDAYFDTPISLDGTSTGVLQMKNIRNGNVVELVNSGAYPDLMITNFSITYTPRVAPGIYGGHFEIKYDILSESDPDKVRNVQTIVRLMND